MLEKRPEVERAIRTIAGARGYEIQSSPDSHAGQKIYLRYRSTNGGPDRVEVDINFLHRINVLDAQELQVWQPDGWPTVRAKVLALEELIAGKLVALFSRRHPRDYYDVTRIPDMLGEDWIDGVTRALFVGLAASLARPYFHRSHERIRKGLQGDVARDLLPMLPREHRTEAAHLLECTWKVVEPLTRTSSAEQESTERMQVGESAPELHFPDDPLIADRLRQSPPFQRKANSSEHAARASPIALS